MNLWLEYTENSASLELIDCVKRERDDLYQLLLWLIANQNPKPEVAMADDGSMRFLWNKTNDAPR